MHKLLGNKFYHEILAFLASAVILLLLAILFSSIYTPKKGKSQTQTISSASPSPNKGVFYNYVSGTTAELALISSLSRPNQITLFGSSEFNDEPMVPYNYLPNEYGIATVGFGHAFHQNFSIFCELLAGDEHLNESKIVLFISPGWFETEGTNSEAFLEFVPSHFLEKIWNDDDISVESKAEIGRYINENASNFSGLTKQMQNFQDLYLAEYTLSPSKKLKKKLTEIYPNLNVSKQISYQTNENSLLKKTIAPSNGQIKDSLLKQFLRASSNNSMFVDSTYYLQNILQADGTIKKGKVDGIDVSSNREYRDFLLVIELLKARKANFSVVIQGLNPFYYSNLSEMDPFIKSLIDELEKDNTPYLNLFYSDTNKYQPGTLSDVMHLGDLGWLRVNEFILKTYSK